MKSTAAQPDPMKLKPIRLTDQISEVIKEQIFNGSLRPGDRVVEQKLAKQLGVGQNAIREALIALAHTGFVRRVPNVGTYVTQITAAEGRQIARVRAALEGLVIDLIIERMQKENLDFTELDRHLGRMRSLLRAHDMVTFYEADIDFHRALWRFAANDYLSQMLEQIVVPLFAFFIMVNHDPKRQMKDIIEATEIHADIVQGLKANSLPAAHGAVQRLMDTSLRFSKSGKSPDRV